jgi:hypothetical protein
MTVEMNKTDLVQKALYDHRAKNGMIPVIGSLKGEGKELTHEELTPIADILGETRFAIFQNILREVDQKGTITHSVIGFVFTNSFSKPGTTILNL